MSSEDNLDTVELPASAPSEGTVREPAAHVEVDLGARTHPGRVRSNNEDHFLVARFDRTLQTLLTNLPPGHLPQRCGETVYALVVADGMGGEAAGEVASRMAITTLVELVLCTPDWIMRLNEHLAMEVAQRMAQRFRQVRETLVEQTRLDPSLHGMGTTMTLAVSLGADLLITHVGDSRAYLFRQGKLHRLTRDQTLAQAMVDAGVLSPEEVATHSLRHVLLGVLGTKGEETRAELISWRLEDGDQLLLCTDGLTDMVPDPAIAEVLQKDSPAADACDTLLGMALEQGGKDNVTVVLARYHIAQEPGPDHAEQDPL